MPIKPENRKLYPRTKEWKEIRAGILGRARDRCEFCGVKNYAVGYRDDDGEFHEEPVQCCYDAGVFQIILTIAHLDHNPENNSEDNLRALCQRCHNRYDASHRRD